MVTDAAVSTRKMIYCYFTCLQSVKMNKCLSVALLCLVMADLVFSIKDLVAFLAYTDYIPFCNMGLITNRYGLTAALCYSVLNRNVRGQLLQIDETVALETVPNFLLGKQHPILEVKGDNGSITNSILALIILKTPMSQTNEFFLNYLPLPSDFFCIAKMDSLKIYGYVTGCFYHIFAEATDDSYSINSFQLQIINEGFESVNWAGSPLFKNRKLVAICNEFDGTSVSCINIYTYLRKFLLSYLLNVEKIALPHEWIQLMEVPEEYLTIPTKKMRLF